jgi:hypothetical protein
MALVGFTAQQCVRRQWSTSWRVSGWDDLGDYQQSGALSITIDETDAQAGGSTQATIIADGSAFTVNGSALPGWVSTVGTRNLVCLVLVGDTIHATANGETLARAMGLAGITGAGSVVLGAVGSSAAGTVLSGRVGTSSVTLGAVTSSASGVIGAAPASGTSSVTLGAVVSTAAGTVASAGPSDVLTFGALAGTTTATTSGGYQSLASSAVSWNSAAGTPDRKLQDNPAGEIYFEVLIPTVATQVSIGLHTDKTTAVTVFNCAVVMYADGSKYNAFGGASTQVGAQRNVAAGDIFQWLRTSTAGTDTLIGRVSSDNRATWTTIVQAPAEPTADLFPRIGFNSAASGVVVRCNGAAA